MEHLLKVEAVAEAIGMGRSMTYQLIQRGDIPHVRIGTAIRVRPEDLRAWIATLPYNGPEELRPTTEE